MKKILSVMIIFISLFSTTLSAFAGSVPEDMLHDYEAQVFFAELVSYRPDGNGETEANLIPTKIIKGDVELGKSLWYSNLSKCGDFTPVMGEEYLFLYYDEFNPTYFFKTTTQDTKTLKLVCNDGDMWDRLEQYLNEGKFEEAEKQRLEAAKSRTLSELLYSETFLTDEIRFVYRKGADSQQIEVDKKEFFEILDGISATQISPTINSETDGFFITTISDAKEREIFISEDGLVSENNNKAASIVEAAEYKINRGDLNKLYLCANIEMPDDNSKTIYIVSAIGVAIILILCFIFFMKKKKSV